MHATGFWSLTAIDPDTGQTQSATFSPSAVERSSGMDFGPQWRVQSLLLRSIRLRMAMAKKAKATDIAALTYLHVDIDPRKWSADVEIDKAAYLDEERVRILSLLREGRPAGVPKPTAIVFSGGGYQAFWRLVEPLPLDGSPEAADKAKLWSQSLERQFGCADSVHNVDRIMRLPGTVNVPTKKKRDNGRVPTSQRSWRPIGRSPIRSAPSSRLRRRRRRSPRATTTTTRVTSTRMQSWSSSPTCTTSTSTPPTASRSKIASSASFRMALTNWIHRPDCEEDKTDRSRWVSTWACALKRRSVPDNVDPVRAARTATSASAITSTTVRATRESTRRVRSGRAKERVAFEPG